MTLKVSLLIWQLLLNYPIKKDKLTHHGIIMYTSGLCSSGCGHDESVDRLFLSRFLRFITLLFQFS